MDRGARSGALMMASGSRPGPHGSSRLRTALDYRRYPTFSWDWSWRRSVLLGAILSLYGVVNGTTNGLMLDDWRIGIGSGLITAFIMVVIVAIGPLAASWVRSRGWTPRWERTGVIAAVLLGVAASHGGNWIGSEYGQRVILSRTMRETTVNPDYLARLHAVNSSTIVWIADTFLFFLASGGISLRTYLEEQRRAVEEAHEQELGELQLQRRQADLQLLVLQAQIEPHFLFNTLASLRSLLRQDVGRAEAMLDALVAHLRAALPVIRDTKETSTLEEQLAICSSYLELMTVRLPDRLT
ncbi:MAG: histidine kinase, partial [Steroidobacteraceae bacterium]